MTNPDTHISLAGIEMKNPVMVASGTFGYGEEYAGLVDIDKLGAIVVKGIGLEPWDGNPPPRIVELDGGLINAIGLQNPGVEGFAAKYMPFLREHDVPVIVNVWGKTVDEYAEVSSALDKVDGVHGLELNVSCPNIKAGGIAFGGSADMLARVVGEARKKTRLPLIVKLPPNVPDIAVLARAAEDSGANALSLINTIPAMVIDVETRKPVLSNLTGGLSGPAVHSVAVKLVWEAARAVDLDIVGIGGVYGPRDAIEFIIAGAKAVAVGTANFMDPTVGLDVAEGIEKYLVNHGMKSVEELVGSINTG